MTPEQKSKASAELTFSAFFFLGAKTPIAKEVADQMKLNRLQPEELKALGIERRVINLADDMAPAAKSLTNIEARDWYNGQVAKIDNIEQEMRKAGKPVEEIQHDITTFRNQVKRQTRDSMIDRVTAERLDKESPIQTPEWYLAKCGGDYEKAIAASKRTNKAVNDQIETLRRENEQK